MLVFSFINTFHSDDCIRVITQCAIKTTAAVLAAGGVSVSSRLVVSEETFRFSRWFSLNLRSRFQSWKWRASVRAAALYLTSSSLSYEINFAFTKPPAECSCAGLCSRAGVRRHFWSRQPVFQKSRVKESNRLQRVRRLRVMLNIHSVTH